MGARDEAGVLPKRKDEAVTVPVPEASGGEGAQDLGFQHLHKGGAGSWAGEPDGSTSSQRRLEGCLLEGRPGHVCPHSGFGWEKQRKASFEESDDKPEGCINEQQELSAKNITKTSPKPLKPAGPSRSKATSIYRDISTQDDPGPPRRQELHRGRTGAWGVMGKVAVGAPHSTKRTSGSGNQGSWPNAALASPCSPRRTSTSASTREAPASVLETDRRLFHPAEASSGFSWRQGAPFWPGTPLRLLQCSGHLSRSTSSSRDPGHTETTPVYTRGSGCPPVERQLNTDG